MDDIIVKVSELYMKYGIKSVSMDDVARELGISKKTLYQHFTDKDELVQKVVDYHMDMQEQEMKKIACAGHNAIEELLMVSKNITQLLKQTNPSVTYDLQKYYPETWRSIAINPEGSYLQADNIQHG